MKSSEYSDQTENFRKMVANEANNSVKSVTLEPEWKTAMALYNLETSSKSLDSKSH